MTEYVLETKDIVKNFGTVKALVGVNFSIIKGEIHALCGENGAGKSTLMKILSGLYNFGSYSGEVYINGELQKFRNTHESEKAGIAIIYQELALVREMTVCENIFLGSEFSHFGFIDWNLAYLKTKKILAEVKLNVNPNTKVSTLSIGEQQLVEIAKAIAKNANILILDEPTAALTESEANNLLKIIKELRDKGKTCIYISHRLKEVFQIADRVTILRDGRTISTQLSTELNEEKLIAKMVGRELVSIYPRVDRVCGETILDVKNWSVLHPQTSAEVIHNVSFQLKKGQILGIAGLMGSGRTELMMSLFGAWGEVSSGAIVLNGKLLKIANEEDAIRSGLALVSEDRKRFGLVLGMDVKQNVTLSSLRALAMLGIIDHNKEVSLSQKFISDLRIKTNSVEQFVGNLSGGNQQKVVLSKWLMTNPKVLILDEPTRGIDVGTKFEIYTIINKLVEQGVGIIVISSELPEVIGVSDEILVMHEGKIAAQLSHAEATQEKIMHYATGNN